MNASLDEARQLYAAAQRDITSLDILIASGRAPHETIGFLAQQACEKLIKTLMVLHSIKIERTHDLDLLAHLATAGGITLPIDAVELGQLNPYAVALRYEGSEVHWVTEQQAVNLVNKLNSFVQQSLQTASNAQ